MSVCYDIREHLNVKKHFEECYTAGDECADYMIGRLAILAAFVLQDAAEIFELNLSADGVDYAFSGKEITPEYKKILTALSEAEEIDITVLYSCTANSDTLSDTVLPFGFTEFLDEQSEEDMRGVFYSMWNTADCADGPGILCAYGEKDGKYYNGIVDYEEVASCPDGNWRATDTLIWLEPDDPAAAKPEVVKACEAFREISDDVDLTADEKGLFFALNNLDIDSPAKCERFLELVAALSELLPDEFGVMANFVDDGSADAQLMIIDTDAGAAPIIKVARV